MDTQRQCRAAERAYADLASDMHRAGTAIAKCYSIGMECPVDVGVKILTLRPKSYQQSFTAEQFDWMRKPTLDALEQHIALEIARDIRQQIVKQLYG